MFFRGVTSAEWTVGQVINRSASPEEMTRSLIGGISLGGAYTHQLSLPPSDHILAPAPAAPLGTYLPTDSL